MTECLGKADMRARLSEARHDHQLLASQTSGPPPGEAQWVLARSSVVRIRHAKCGLLQVRMTCGASDTSLPNAACSPNTSWQSVGGCTVIRGVNSTCKLWYSLSKDDMRGPRHVSPERGMITKYKPSKHLGLTRGVGRPPPPCGRGCGWVGIVAGEGRDTTRAHHAHHARTHARTHSAR